jgi:tetratricopeptide (TPR) repeat protein
MEGKSLYHYLGSRPFEDTDSDRKRFFGREREKDELLQKIIAGKLVVLHAVSGLGKTSLLNAGVSALLRERGFLPIKIRFNLAEISPVQAVFIGIEETAAQQSLDIEPGEMETLWHYFKTAAFWSTDDSLLTPVLIFDQFEEFFAFHEPEVRNEFISQLADLVHNTIPSALRQNIREGDPYRYGDEPPRVKMVISIRGDFLGQLDELSSSIPEILENRFRLLALTRKQAREAITGPAQIEDEQIFTQRFRYSEDAVNTMLDYLSKRQERCGVVNKDEVESFQLQLLCWHIETKILEKVVKAGGQEELEVKKEDLGGETGMNKVFQHFYENQLTGLKPVLEKRRVRRLCEKGLTSASNRRRSLEEGDIEKRFKVSPALLAQLVDNRLLRAEKRVSSVYYELSHDTLITPIRLSQRRHRATIEKYALLFLLPLVLAIIAVIMNLTSVYTAKQNKLDRLFTEADQFIFDSNFNKAIGKYKKIREMDPKNIMAIVKLGELLKATRRYEDAVKLYKKAIDNGIRDGRVIIGYWKMLFKTGKEEEAINYIDEAITRNPRDTNAYETLGDHYAEKKDFKIASENYEKVLDINKKSKRVYEKLAVLYVEKGEKEKAIDVFKRAISVDVEYVGIYEEISDVLKQKEYTETLENLYGTAYDVKIKDADHYFGLGNDYYYLKKYDAAIASYRKALELKPEAAGAYYNMGSAQGKKGDYDAAIASYQKAQELNPDEADAYNNMGVAQADKGDYDAAIASYQKALELKPDEAVAYNNMGIAQADKGDYDAAIASYKKALELKPDYADAYNNMGVAQDNKGDTVAAIASYKKALELKPDYADAYNNMGVAQDNKGDTVAAIASYKKALELKPDYDVAYNNMGVAYRKKGDYAAAIASYKKALELKQDNADAYNNMGIAQADKGDYDAAITSYKKVLELKPNYVEAYNNMGMAHYRKGDYDAAIASYQKVLELKPDYAEAYNNMGVAQSSKGDYDAAIASYREALKLKPDYAGAYNNMGMAQYRKGDYDAAIASYQKVLELKPDYAEAYNNMGVAQSSKGDYDAAIASYQKALEIKPTYLSAKTNISELYLTTERFDKAMELAHQVLKEKDVPQDKILAMKSIVISSLFFQGNQTQALMELQQLITYYRSLTNEFKRDWDYSPTKKFITGTQRLSEPTRSLLLKLIDLLEAPRKEAEPILVELEKMVKKYKR